MKEKKKLLFVIESLACAGAEKSLLSLLTLIDYDKFDVDLQLFSRGGEFEVYIPDEVTILPIPRFFSECKKSLIKNFISLKWKHCISRLLFSIENRIFPAKNNTCSARRLWKYAHKLLFAKNPDKTYDVAIAYAHGVPTYYVADKIKATMKFAWINGVFNLDSELIEWQQKFYQKFNSIICVSDIAYSAFVSSNEKLANKAIIIWDIVNPSFIKALSTERFVYHETKEPILLTVARYTYQKGYDIAIKAAKILKDKGIAFKWLAVGKGDMRDEMLQMINQYGLEDVFILEGATPNPYPYFKRAHIYVHTSRTEGFGLAIAEARLLNVPVVTTEFDSVHMQIKHEKNGLITPMTPEAVASAIEKLLSSNTLHSAIADNLRSEKKGNIDEINKLYNLIY